MKINENLTRNFSLTLFIDDSELILDITTTADHVEENLIRRKGQHLQLMLDCIFTLTLVCNPQSPRPIPAGEVYFFFKNRNPIYSNEILTACSDHSENLGEPIFELIDENNSSMVVLDGKHIGFRWTIPDGNEAREMRLPIKFKCATSDAEYANVRSLWSTHIFYSGDIHNYTLLSTLDVFKVTRPQKTEKKIHTKSCLSIPNEDEKETRVPPSVIPMNDRVRSVLSSMKLFLSMLREVDAVGFVLTDCQSCVQTNGIMHQPMESINILKRASVKDIMRADFGLEHH